jgi:hypothetical protein
VIGTVSAKSRIMRIPAVTGYDSALGVNQRVREAKFPDTARDFGGRAQALLETKCWRQRSRVRAKPGDRLNARSSS